MICTSFGRIEGAFHPGLLEGLECAEIRLDLLGLDHQQVSQVFSRRQTLVATCRPGVMNDALRISLLAAAVEAGAAYLDLDLDEKPGFFSLLVKLARRLDCRLIVSYHNYQRTPGLNSLRRKAADCRRAGADVVKIACLVTEPAEAARIVSLYDLCRFRPGGLLALGMGLSGAWTRLAALQLGAPFSYACPDNLPATAPGQMSTSQMKRLVRLLNPEEER